MSTTTSTTDSTISSGARLTLATAAGVSLATVFTAIGTFVEPDDDAWRQMLIVFGIILVTAALAVWTVRRALVADGMNRLARTSVALGILAVVSLVVFWAGPPAVLASAATVLALEARDRRGGRWGRGPATAMVLSAIAVVLAGVVAVIG